MIEIIKQGNTSKTRQICPNCLRRNGIQYFANEDQYECLTCGCKWREVEERKEKEECRECRDCYRPTLICEGKQERCGNFLPALNQKKESGPLKVYEQIIESKILMGGFNLPDF